VLLLVLQLVPYGRDHTSPTATKQVELATAQQRELFRTACQDCHSYNTDWLWYSNVAPVSWLIQSDVDGGREHFNLSTWDRPQPELSDVVDQIENGEMPPLKYWISPYHRNARLSDTEMRAIHRRSGTALSNGRFPATEHGREATANRCGRRSDFRASGSVPFPMIGQNPRRTICAGAR
jgi:Haem-binding domain